MPFLLIELVLLFAFLLAPDLIIVPLRAIVA
jgi:hypothetical protein